MATTRPRSTVRIEQPTSNKVVTLVIGGTAAFLVLILVSAIDARGFQIALVAFLAAVLFYAYRSMNIVAKADRDRIDIQNLTSHRVVAWSDVDVLAVAETKSGPGTGLEVRMRDGTTVAVEASWGAWFQGKQHASTTRRCEELIVAIEAMRAGVPEPEEPSEAVDPIRVRPTRSEDVETVAAVIDAARRETYEDILPGQIFERDGRDADALSAIVADDSRGSGSLLVERDGTVVGASVFGPASGDDLEGFVEIYMIYVRSAEIGTASATRLTLATHRIIRQNGAAGIVGQVYVGNRRFRSQVERLGITRVGEPVEQIWYGLPVKVVEYRRTLPPRDRT